MHRPLLLLACLSVATAHICMWQPLQRGEFNIGEPGHPSCYRKVGPCGLDTPGVVTSLTGGQQLTVQFQQNLNHYYVGNPGYMDVSWAKGQHPQESDFMPLHSHKGATSSGVVADYNAMNEITQTNFSVTVTVPDVACDACVLRVRYVSNNPLENDRGEIFYQCADIAITKPAVAAAPAAAAAPSMFPNPLLLAVLLSNAPNSQRSAADPAGCCTPQQWQTGFYRTDSYTGRPVYGTIWYDGVGKYMRVDMEMGDGKTIYDGKFSMTMNFTNGLEYYYNVNTNNCDLYGLDYWNDWCYGTVNQTETFQQSLTVGSTVCNVWKNGEFLFIHEVNTCIPTFLVRTTGDTTVYFNFVAHVDTSVFTPPAVCPDHVSAAVGSRKASRSAAAAPEPLSLLRAISRRL